MGERTGLSLIDELVLTTLDDIGARAERPHVKCARAMEATWERHRVAPDHTYEALIRLARADLVMVPLIDGHGNFGSPDWPAANARYIECRLSAAGELAVASERGVVPPVPFGLLNGTMHEGGRQPAFAAEGLLAAMEAAAAGAGDDVVTAALGLPVFPTGCLVEGDVAALHAGEPVRLRCSARLAVDGARILITDFPPGAAPSGVLEALATSIGLVRSGRLDDHPELRAKAAVAARDANNLTTGNRPTVEVLPEHGMAAEALLEPLRNLWLLSHDVTMALPGPAADLVRRVDPAALTHLRRLFG